MYIVRASLNLNTSGSKKEERIVIAKLDMLAEDYNEANNIRKKFKDWLEYKNKRIKGEISYSIECVEDIGKEREVGDHIKRKKGSSRIIDSNF